MHFESLGNLRIMENHAVIFRGLSFMENHAVILNISESFPCVFPQLTSAVARSLGRQGGHGAVSHIQIWHRVLRLPKLL